MGTFFGSWVDNLGIKTLTNIVIALAGDNLPGLVSNLTSSARNKFDRKANGNGTARAEKGFTLFVLNQNMNDIIKVIRSLED